MRDSQEADFEGHSKADVQLSLRVLVVDDCRLYRESLSNILSEQIGVSSVCSADDLESLHLQQARCHPDPTWAKTSAQVCSGRGAR